MPARYSPLTPSSEKFDPISLEAQRHPRNTTPVRWSWITHGVLLLSSIMFFIRGYIYSRPTTRLFVDEFSTYSPAARAVRYEDILFNTTTSTSPPSSEYIGHGANVDSAWEKLSNAPGTLMIDDRELYLLEKPKTVAKVTDTKTGKSGYRVTLEVFHQLHCLDVVRKASYGIRTTSKTSSPAGMEEQGLSDSEVILDQDREELDNCLEILRMNLMCQADIGLVTFTEDKESGLKPDYSTWHTCRNFDGVIDWAKKNAVHE